MNIFLAILKALKLPLKLLIGGKQKRKPTELEQKCWQHVKNFAPTHYSWQIKTDKKLTKKQRKYHKESKTNFN